MRNFFAIRTGDASIIGEGHAVGDVMSPCLYGGIKQQILFVNKNLPKKQNIFAKRISPIY